MVMSSWKGIVGATALVALTTADDAVWLLKYTHPSLHLYTRVTNGVLFVATLSALSIGCVVAALLIEKAVIAGGCSTPENEEVIMGIVGASICWAIAAFLFVKKMLKRRRKLAQQASAVAAGAAHNGVQYGSIEEGSRSIVKDLADDFDNASSSSSSSDSSFDDDGQEISQSPSVLAVISMTTLGALDELSYLPSLVIGRVFTPVELCLGTLLASLSVLIVVVFFLSTFKPLIDFVDRIPLYGIIATFAVVLTIGVIIDVLNG